MLSLTVENLISMTHRACQLKRRRLVMENNDRAIRLDLNTNTPDLILMNLRIQNHSMP